MKQFKATVPLMVSLKNEALRERHWHQLMEKTGEYFDMAPDRFTLENMFAMQLHKYQVKIEMKSVNDNDNDNNNNNNLTNLKQLKYYFKM